MIWVLAHVCLSATVPVGDDNFESVLKMGKPVLLELWNPYCGHCRAFRPTWEKLAEQSAFKDNIVFADANCLENRKFCNGFEFDGYPSLLFISDKGKNLLYEGSMTVEAIDAFIEKHLSYPVKFIQSDAEFEKALRKTNMSSVFVMEYVNTKDIRLQTFRAAAQAARKMDCIFLAKWSNVTKLTAFLSPRKAVEYQGNWSRESLDVFVTTHKFCALPPLTTSSIDEFSSSGRLLFLAFLKHPDYDTVSTMADNLALPHQMFYELATANSYLAAYMGVSSADLPCFAIIDFNHSRWAFAPFNDLDNLKQWVSNIKSGRVAWRGPGTHYFVTLWEKIWAIKATGGLLLAVVVLCICAIVVLLLGMSYDCYLFSKLPSKKE